MKFEPVVTAFNGFRNRVTGRVHLSLCSSGITEIPEAEAAKLTRRICGSILSEPPVPVVSTLTVPILPFV